MAELCKNILNKLIAFNNAHLQEFAKNKVPVNERYYFYWKERYSAPWVICSIFVMFGIRVIIDESTTWDQLGLVQSESFGGLGILTNKNMQCPEVARLLRALYVTSPVDFIKNGLSMIHPRELRMHICLCKQYFGPVLISLDNNEDFYFPDMEVRETKRRIKKRKGETEDSYCHIMLGSIVGVQSDVPKCRNQSFPCRYRSNASGDLIVSL